MSLEYAREVLLTEALAIQKVASLLDSVRNGNGL